ncbi:HPr kinase/phosphorylase [hydrothermal vent metagenome]|uniref:HPr kinase/phosphorylase n=1 Tax=hydrothermal vent metagenome TaxID=652676 RepID=A0A3B0YD76_9ZZZZ
MSREDWLSSILEPLQLELKGDSPDIASRPDNILVIGILNPLRPSLVQIIGPEQQTQLDGLSDSSRHEVISHIANSGTQLLVACDGVSITNKSFPISVAYTPLSSDEVLTYIPEINSIESEDTYQHGVFMDVLGSGVMLTGSANIGKSELALELITRGHSLIADDSPCFSLTSGGHIKGVSPPILREFLEVRGLGVVNVRAMFGDSAVKHHKNLNLIIHLHHIEDNDKIVIDRLFGAIHQQTILGQQVDSIELPIAEGRNMAVLVETAVRNYNLKLKGYNSAKEFIKRQQSFINKNNDRNNGQDDA